MTRLRHKIVKRVTEQYAGLQFNTGLAALMELVNGLNHAREESPEVVRTPVFAEAVETLTVLLAPLAPYISEELWHQLGRTTSVHAEAWPTYDDALTRDELVTVVVQVNGKVRERLELPAESTEEAVRAQALASPRVQALLDGQPVKKVVYVPGRLVNLVV